MTATQEFVVPKSIPTTFGITFFSLANRCDHKKIGLTGLALKIGLPILFGSRANR
jgi:hypothetical protein